MACLYVSTKMHDTLKKPRDILMVSYTVRFPELAARSKAIGGEVEIDPAVRLSLNITSPNLLAKCVIPADADELRIDRQSNKTGSTYWE